MQKLAYLLYYDLLKLFVEILKIVWLTDSYQVMEFTVYKKTEEEIDEYVGKGAKKKKQKGSKEASPGMIIQ